MGENAAFPLARSEDVLTEKVGEETVVYDERSKRAHCLNPLAARVFARCDGRTSIPELAQAAGSELGEPVTSERVEEVLADLEASSLLEAQDQPRIISRRQLVRRGALVGAAVAATPFVTTVVTPAYAASCTGGSCTNNSQCGEASCGTGRACRCRCTDGTSGIHTCTGGSGTCTCCSTTDGPC